jgi:beta-lactamase superfamily II metal-dependent hydrolase
MPIILLVAALALGTWVGWKPASGPPLGPTLRAEFIDVGPGECTLIRTPDGASVLVDSGAEEHVGAVTDRLRAVGIEHLDYLVMTNPGSGHIGGVPKMLESMPVDIVLDGCISAETPAYRQALDTIAQRRIKYAELRAGMNIGVGRDAVLQVFAPSQDRSGWSGDPDDRSAVMRLVFGRARILLTSGIGRNGEAALISGNENLESQVLKVADHGSRGSTSLEMLRHVRPEHLVMFCGDGRSPHRRTLERLSEDRTGAVLYRTDQNGTVTVRTDGRRIVVETER